MIPFPSLYAAMWWWVRNIKDRPVSVLIDDPAFPLTESNTARRTIDRGTGGWRIRHA